MDEGSLLTNFLYTLTAFLDFLANLALGAAYSPV
jgi:hypothetical protein